MKFKIDQSKHAHGMIYNENRPFPAYIRTEKEIDALCAKSHRISVLTQRVPYKAPQEKMYLKAEHA